MKRYPHCLLCFLDDDFQSDLRAAAQHSAPRHEKALTAYAQLFQKALSGLGSVSSCAHHKLENEHFTWWVDETLKLIQSQPTQEIFDGMTEAYSTSIAGRFGESFERVKSLMLKLGIDKTRSERLGKVLFFRGRKGRLLREDLYHIPFSKRHCISNQRYSVTGQPLLYLGLSILDVACELGAEPKAVDDYSFCSYFLKDSATTRVLDLGNSLYDSLWNNIRPIAGAGSQLKHMAEAGGLPAISRQTVIERLKIFVIAAVCSFRRRMVTAQDSFAPEYVLPQTMAHWARETAFDGILYTSTRIDSEHWRMSGDLQLNRYRENLALFTKYVSHEEKDHDESLLAKFEISPPIQAADVKEISDDVIVEYRKQIVQGLQAQSLTELGQRAAIDVDVAFDGLVYSQLDLPDVPYYQTTCGKIQRYLQLLFMMSRLIDA